MPIIDSTSFRDILVNRLLEIRERSPRFSQRAFARRLGLSSGALSDLLNLKRPVTPKLAMRLANTLAFSRLECRSLGLKVPESAESSVEIREDVFTLISDWRYFATLNLLKTKNFKSNCLWMAKRLGITVEQVEQVLKRLLKLGLIKKSSEKKWVRTFNKVNTTDEVTSASLLKSHCLDFDIIKCSMSEVDLEHRDSTSVTFVMDIGKMPEIKRLIRQFQDELMDLAESKNGDEVYRLSMHLFPLTKLNFNARKK